MADKQDTTFRLLKPGVQIVFRGKIFKRERDLKAGAKMLKRITRKSFVPYQLILDRLKDQKKEIVENFMKQFESEVVKEIPDLKKPVKKEKPVVKETKEVKK